MSVITSDHIKDYTTRMLDMLIDRCPRLMDLQLHLCDAEVAPVINLFSIRCCWPMLKRLTLRFKTEMTNKKIIDILVSHPSLERVHIRP